MALTFVSVTINMPDVWCVTCADTVRSEGLRPDVTGGHGSYAESDEGTATDADN